MLIHGIQGMTKHNLKAIIYDKRGRILSIGYNNYTKTHPLQQRLAKKHNLEHKIYIHAELHAILRCNDITKAHKIFVCRYDYLGNAKLAKPCKMCMDVIQIVGIKEVEYTE